MANVNGGLGSLWLSSSILPASPSVQPTPLNMFSCFFAPLNHSRSKKVVQQSAGAMQSSPKEISRDQAPKASPYYDNNLSNTSAEQVTTPSSHDGCWKSDDLNGNYVPDDSKDFHRMVRLKKSQSLGSVLDKRRGFSGDDVTEGDEMDQEFSFDYCHDNNMKSVGDSFENAGSAEADDHVDTGVNTRNHHQKNEVADSFGFIATPEHHESLFSIGVLNQFDGEQHDEVGEHSVDHIVDSLHSSSNTLRNFAKSLSATNLRGDATDSIEGALTPELIRPRSRSFEDLCSLHGGREGFLNDEDILCSEVIFQRHITGSHSHNKQELSDLDGHLAADSREECAPSNTSGGFNDLAEQERNGKYLNEKFECDNQSVGVYEPHNNDDLPNEWREPENDGVEVKKTRQQDSSIQNWGELTSEEFKIKRIEEWINKIDFQNGSSVELGESSSSPKKDANIPKKDSQVVAGVATAKHGANSLGMEVAYNYISSLSASSSSAQMSNLGLVAVPFLGSFVGLRVLNLSGNAIVRITTGALPRGLHLLNLSKNTISTIEGLRDLTRLRVLDLSYNRIVRIGHGLASCSSLKELYLAGNKISEVEGLHRLLKLNILDLRFNKMSTAKGLGQLAANYGSLQAINLEGNPAQRNVRDEQLKKYLLSLLPHLVYYNKQTIKANCSKDVSDRPLRSLASHQFDRGTRTEQNYSRRGSHGTSLHRSTSSIHGRSNPAVSSSKKQSKNRHVHLPPAGSKAIHHQPNLGTKPLSSLPSNPIRRISSGGTL